LLPPIGEVYVPVPQSRQREDVGRVERLLRAEQSAEEDVARAEQAAREVLGAARERARRIAARADERITRLRSCSSERVAERIEALRASAEARGREQRRPLSDPSHVERAMRRVADELLGEERGA
jgi:vacuolar-type H+-ATPase subunit H